jgi:hypothetical protein
MAGGNRGLWALRVPLEHLGVLYTRICSRSQADRAFHNAGRIADPELGARFDRTLADFLALTEAAVCYLQVKSVWI